MGQESSQTTTVIHPGTPIQSTQPTKTEEQAPQQTEEQPIEEESESIDENEFEDLVKKHRERIRMRLSMKKEEFNKLRNSNTLEDAIECMNKLGRCVNNIDTNDAKKRLSEEGIGEKILFIVVNTYEKPQYQLGVGPMNDAITVAINHKKFGYRILYLHNSTPTIFKKWLKFLLKHTEKDLTIFYTGHGCSLKDKNGDESDGYDEVMLFDNGYVVDDELADYLLRYAHGQRIVLLSDCCHSGSMWDIQSMLKADKSVWPNIISISSAKDDQTAKQTKVEAKDQGIFSYYFWEIIEQYPDISAQDMEAKINPLIGKFSQHFAYATTTKGMESQPMFPNRERKRRRGRRGGKRGGRRERSEQ